jgi:hypothetical protein
MELRAFLTELLQANPMNTVFILGGLSGPLCCLAVPLTVRFVHSLTPDVSGSSNDLRDQRNGVFKIFEINDTAWRMDVTAGNRDDSSQDPFTAQMNGARIRTSVKRELMLPRNLQGISSFFDKTDQRGIDDN